MIPTRSVIASCFAAVCLLQMAPAAVAAGADALSADTLRTDQGGSEAAQMERRAREAAISTVADGGGPLKDGGRYRIKLTSTAGANPPADWANPLYVAADDSFDGRRDSWSFYVFGGEAADADAEAVFVAEFDSTNWAYMFKQEKSGWYLASHNWYTSDNLEPGDFRLIVHSDPEKVILWGLQVWKDDTYIMNVVKNLEQHSQMLQGMHLGMPFFTLVRDDISEYLAVVDGTTQAALIEFEEL